VRSRATVDLAGTVDANNTEVAGVGNGGLTLLGGLVANNGRVGVETANLQRGHLVGVGNIGTARNHRTAH
jgi:hypothetical protein